MGEAVLIRDFMNERNRMNPECDVLFEKILVEIGKDGTSINIINPEGTSNSWLKVASTITMLTLDNIEKMLSTQYTTMMRDAKMLVMFAK